MPSYEWKYGLLAPIEGPLDYEWTSHEAALTLAGFTRDAEYVPRDMVGHLVLYSRRTPEANFPWPYEFLCDYGLTGDTCGQVYCRTYQDALEFMRFVQPLIEMSWRCSQQSDDWDDRMKKERSKYPTPPMSKQERQERNVEYDARQRKEFEETQRAWLLHLATAQSTVTA